MTDQELDEIQQRASCYENDVYTLMAEITRLRTIVRMVESKDFMIVATSTIERMQEELCRLKRGEK